MPIHRDELDQHFDVQPEITEDGDLVRVQIFGKYGDSTVKHLTPETARLLAKDLERIASMI